MSLIALKVLDYVCTVIDIVRDFTDFCLSVVILVKSVSNNVLIKVTLSCDYNDDELMLTIHWRWRRWKLSWSSFVTSRPAGQLTDRMTIGPTDQFIDLLIDSVRLWNWLPLTPVCNFIIYSLLVTCLRWRFYCYLLMQLKINQIMNEKGFFLTMPPIAGAVDAVKEMSEMDGYVTGSLRFIVCY